MPWVNAEQLLKVSDKLKFGLAGVKIRAVKLPGLFIRYQGSIRPPMNRAIFRTHLRYFIC